MTAQELLDALNKIQTRKNLEPTARWAISEYLRTTWKDGLGKNIRPYELGAALSGFFVDLSQHRLPERITKHSPETEPNLVKFFGAADGGLSQFWKQCSEIWGRALEPHPAYARDVRNYFDLLIQSSLQEKGTPSPKGSTEVTTEKSTEGSTQPSYETSSSVPIKPPSDMGETQAPDSTSQKNAPTTPELTELPKDETKPPVFPKSAFLVLQGTRVIPLNQPVILIGRRLDNHIILEDPRVSRTHAQIKLINDRFVIFDTNSTGGTYVNGRRTAQSVLYPGDVISLAGVIFIYSQELPAKPGDVKIIELGSPFAADRPTAVVRKEELKPDTKPGKKDMPDLPKTGPL